MLLLQLFWTIFLLLEGFYFYFNHSFWQREIRFFILFVCLEGGCKQPANRIAHESRGNSVATPKTGFLFVNTPFFLNFLRTRAEEIWWQPLNKFQKKTKNEISLRKRGFHFERNPKPLPSPPAKLPHKIIIAMSICKKGPGNKCRLLWFELFPEKIMWAVYYTKFTKKMKNWNMADRRAFWPWYMNPFINRLFVQVCRRFWARQRKNIILKWNTITAINPNI